MDTNALTTAGGYCSHRLSAHQQNAWGFLDARSGKKNPKQTNQQRKNRLGATGHGAKMSKPFSPGAGKTPSPAQQVPAAPAALLLRGGSRSRPRRAHLPRAAPSFPSSLPPCRPPAPPLTLRGCPRPRRSGGRR